MPRKKTPQIVTILILTLLVIIFWVFFSVYRVFIDKSDAVVPQEIIEPFTSNLDTQTLELAKSRYHADQSVTLPLTSENNESEQEEVVEEIVTEEEIPIDETQTEPETEEVVEESEQTEQ